MELLPVSAGSFFMHLLYVAAPAGDGRGGSNGKGERQ